MLNIHRVDGQSMAPAFADGDYVLCSRLLFRQPLKVGDVVVVQHPRFGRIIKRVTELDQASAMRLSGDNPISTTTAAMGWVPRDALIGRVIWHVKST